MSADQLLALALEMAEDGSSLIPVGSDKKPFLAWKKYQSARADADQLREWAADPRAAGFAVVCGAVSGGLEIIDFDDPEFYAAFMAAAPDWAAGLPVQKTGGGGYQVAYRRETPGGNVKLAWAAREADADGVVLEGGREIAIETRGEGGYAVIPHSLHPSGNRYAPLTGTFGSIPTIEDAQAGELLALARGLDQTPRPQPQPAPQRPAAPRVSTDATGPRAYVLGGIEKELEKVAAARQGERNAALFEAAAALGNLVEAFHTPDGGGRELVGALSEADARALLTEAAQQQGGDDRDTLGQIQDTISSGLEKGKQTPRDVTGKGEKKKAVKVERTKKPSSPALVKVAEAAAGQQRAASLPNPDQIPDPEGEGGSYSGQQIKELLGLSWPVLAADTDKAHAHRLYSLAGDDLAYVPALGGYVAWNGQQWLSGEGKEGAGQVEAKSRAQSIGLAMRPEVARLLALYGVLAVAAAQAEAQSGRDSEAAKAARVKAEAMEKAYFRLDRAAQATENDARQRAILSSAATIYSKLNPKRAQDFEPRPWVVGFQNGTWDRGEFRPARREDHMLRLAPVAYQPHADRADWHAVLDRITGGDLDLQRTLQDVAGYALSGASSLRLLPWLYGEGGTGKGTYSEMLATVLGEMAETISPKHLATDADRERLGAVIWGKRVALCAEAGNARLDAESLKTLSGGDRLSVRKLYAESFTGRASHVLVMVANDAPRVEAYDDALKDRVLALPFKHPLKIGGPLLQGRRLEEMRQDASSALVLGFASWAVEGLERVYRTGQIHRAAVCREATRAFWADVDPLHDFWPLCDPSQLAVNGVPVGEFRAGYEQWAKDNGGRPMTTHKFNKAAKSVGLEQKTVDRVRCWKLVEPEKFPGQQADQQDADGEENGKTDSSLDSQNPKNSSPREREERGFRENSSKSVNPLHAKAAGWEGEEL